MKGMAYVPVFRQTLSQMLGKGTVGPRSSFFSSVIIPTCQYCQFHVKDSYNKAFCVGISYPATYGIKRNLTNKAVDLESKASSVTNQDVKHNTLLNKVSNSLLSLARVVFRKTLLRVSGKNIYQCCADQVDYESFLKVCNLPDTFQSWFLVLQLHIWMCYIRLKADGKEGQIVNRQMVSCMWEDVKERMKVLGVEDSSVIKKSFNELAEQFYGITIAYNKGYLADDETVLLNAFRKNLFNDNEYADKRNIDALLRYVEAQLMLLDEINSEDLLTKGQIKWLTINDFLRTSET